MIKFKLRIILPKIVNVTIPAVEVSDQLKAVIQKGKEDPVFNTTASNDYEKKYNDVKDFINWTEWRHCTTGSGPCTEQRYLNR